MRQHKRVRSHDKIVRRTVTVPKRRSFVWFSNEASVLCFGNGPLHSTLPRSHLQCLLLVAATCSAASSCVFLQTNPISDYMVCADRSSCNPDNDGWDCCARRGGRLQCPGSKPVMCAGQCSGDFCCDYEGDLSCTTAGGRRTCGFSHLPC